MPDDDVSLYAVSDRTTQDVWMFDSLHDAFAFLKTLPSDHQVHIMANTFGAAARPREPQYADCFTSPPVTLGPMIGETWTRDPKKLGITLARYKVVGQLLRGKQHIAEIGCGDGFASRIVQQITNAELDLYDFDRAWRGGNSAVRFFDIAQSALASRYDAIFMLDAIEHIAPIDEAKAFRNIKASLTSNGIFIVGSPSLESQAYASPISRAGHVNCKTGERFMADLQKHFANVFLFGMNDETLHVGFLPMCHYLLAVCTGALQ